MEDTLRIAGLDKESVVNGPGLRYTIFTQGCPHHCEACHNPQTWKLEGGYLVKINDLLQEIRANSLLQGVTFSGGEPFLQATPLAKLGKAVKEMGLDLFVYTGYSWEKLRASSNAAYQELLAVIDILVDGPFQQEKKDLGLLFRGSSNQRLIDVPASLAQNRVVVTDLKR